MVFYNEVKYIVSLYYDVCFDSVDVSLLVIYNILLFFL